MESKQLVTVTINVTFLVFRFTCHSVKDGGKGNVDESGRGKVENISFPQFCKLWMVKRGRRWGGIYSPWSTSHPYSLFLSLSLSRTKQLSFHFAFSICTTQCSFSCIWIAGKGEGDLHYTGCGECYKLCLSSTSSSSKYNFKCKVNKACKPCNISFVYHVVVCMCMHVNM